MLIQVARNELSMVRPLEVNLYLANGDLVARAGTILNAQLAENLQAVTVYRHANHLPLISKSAAALALEASEKLNHEGVIFTLPDTSQADHQALQQEDDAGTIYTADSQTTCLKSIQYFWNSLKKGKSADIALCELISDTLIAEITSKVDQIQYISQLRVRDRFTYSHTLHVSALSIALAQKIGMEADEIRQVALAAILHDLGKLMIPESIMFKASRLTEKEFEVMKLHPRLGYDIIKTSLSLPEPIALPALEHQEMYSGGGYPYNKRGNDIHPYSQIVKVADVYDALTAKRPYKDGIPSQKALNIMLSEGDKSFNPDLLAQFVDMANYEPVDTTTNCDKP